MKCPKCGKEIADNLSVCPSCKKVLKLVCPNCGAENKSNTCKSCGFVIITKCHKCGKINETIKGNCSKCGFSTYTSAAINNSNIDEFACLTVEFPNLENFKDLFGSTKLFEKFKANLDNLIVNYTKNFDLKREIIDNLYIIRFNKDYSFAESANNAMKAAIAIQNLVTELNFKLSKLKNSALECHIAVLKRDIYSRPTDYKSGFNIKLLYQDAKESKLLSKLQIITDNSIYNEISEKYSLSSLSAVMVKHNMVMFFELNLKKYIKIPKEKKDDKNQAQKLELIDKLDSQLYEEEKEAKIEKIDFSEIKCDFKSVENINFNNEICNKIKQNPKNLIVVKKEKNFLIDEMEISKTISNYKKFDRTIYITCTDEMKLKPYGFFAEVFSQIFKFSQSPLLSNTNDFSGFKKHDSGNFIHDFINLVKRDFPHPEDCRFSLFDIFLNAFYELKNTLIIVNDFDKIDDTSFEFFQVLLRKFNDFEFTFILFNSTGFSIHKHSPFLLSNPYYTEIKLKPTKIKDILAKYSEISDLLVSTHYLEVISKFTIGNSSYFETAIDYLIKEKIIGFDNGKFKLVNQRNILVPPSVEKFTEYNFNRLKSNNQQAYSMFILLILLGASTNYKTLLLLNLKDDVKILKALADEKLIFIVNDNIFIKNYNLCRKFVVEKIPEKEINLYINEIVTKVFNNIKHSSCEVYLYNLQGASKSEFITLQNLADVNASLGDFSAYWNCCSRLLKMIDNHITETSQEEVEKYKMQIYENLANLLYKYTPEKIQNIAQIILNNLEKCGNDDQIVVLCNKMLQGCLISGNYSHALKLIHNILSRFPNKSINPENENFDMTFMMLTMVKIEILFSIGDLKDCATAGDEILKLFTNKNVFDYKPENIPNKQFGELLFDSFMFSGISKVLLLANDLKTYLSNLRNTISLGSNKVELPKCFSLLLQLENLIHGYKVNLPEDTSNYQDKFSIIFINLIAAFTMYKEDPKKFANSVYQAKLKASKSNLKQIELFCDALIGYSYLQLGEDVKASSILYNIEENSSQNGLKAILYVVWYLIALLKSKENDTESAIGIASDVSLKMEQSENSSDYLQYLIKLLLKELYTKKGSKNEAEFCQKHIDFLQMEYNLKVKS